MSELLTKSMLQRVAKLSLLPGQTTKGQFSGERKSKRLGTSIEFSDFRRYAPGDDVRQIDWNTYARTNKHYIKRYVDERELEIKIYLDITNSMAFYPKKWLSARQIAGLLSYLALTNDDRAMILTPGNNSGAIMNKGKRAVFKQLHFLNELKAITSSQDFAGLLYQEGLKRDRKSIRIVISDFLEPLSPLFESFKLLQAKSERMLLIQVLDANETNPSFNGDYRFIDSETTEQKEVSINPKVIKQYKARLKMHNETLRNSARKRGIDFISFASSEGIEEHFFQRLRSLGWI